MHDGALRTNLSAMLNCSIDSILVKDINGKKVVDYYYLTAEQAGRLRMELERLGYMVQRRDRGSFFII